MTVLLPLASAVLHLEEGDWQAAHAIVQKDSSPLAAWAHGLAHLMEGDLANAEHWYHRAHRALPGADAIDREIAALKYTLEVEMHRTMSARPPSTEKAVKKDSE